MADFQVVIGKFQNPCHDLVKENVAKKINGLRQRLANAVKKLSKHRRVPANHIFVVMISSEKPICKPYALPIQCIPVRSLKDKQVQAITDNIVAEMVKIHMKVAGYFF